MELANKHALITGGGHGLGRAIAERFASRGARVTIVGRDEARLSDTRDALEMAGFQAQSLQCDVTNAESVAVAIARAEQEFGGVDVLVNNAGVAPTAPLLKLRLEDWNHAFAVNATGTMLCMQACLEGMIARRYGRIVNVASTAGVTSGPYLSAYSASKHAVIGLTKAAALELIGKGIHVNALCPAYIDTDMTKRGVERAVSKGLSQTDAMSAVLSSAGQKRLLTPEEVAAWALVLAGPGGNALTGQVIVLDGGGPIL